MSILLDHQLQEQILYNTRAFPIAFYCDELATFPYYAGAMHWHPYCEIATAKSGVLDYQVGQHHIRLEAGDSICFTESGSYQGRYPTPCQTLCFPVRWLLLKIALFIRNIFNR